MLLIWEVHFWPRGGLIIELEIFVVRIHQFKLFMILFQREKKFIYNLQIRT